MLALLTKVFGGPAHGAWKAKRSRNSVVPIGSNDLDVPIKNNNGEGVSDVKLPPSAAAEVEACGMLCNLFCQLDTMEDEREFVEALEKASSRLDRHCQSQSQAHGHCPSGSVILDLLHSYGWTGRSYDKSIPASDICSTALCNQLATIYLSLKHHETSSSWQVLLERCLIKAYFSNVAVEMVHDNVAVAAVNSLGPSYRTVVRSAKAGPASPDTDGPVKPSALNSKFSCFSNSLVGGYTVCIYLPGFNSVLQSLLESSTFNAVDEEVPCVAGSGTSAAAPINSPRCDGHSSSAAGSEGGNLNADSASLGSSTAGKTIKLNLSAIRGDRALECFHVLTNAYLGQIFSEIYACGGDVLHVTDDYLIICHFKLANQPMKHIDEVNASSPSATLSAGRSASDIHAEADVSTGQDTSKVTTMNFSQQFNVMRCARDVSKMDAGATLGRELRWHQSGSADTSEPQQGGARLFSEMYRPVIVISDRAVDVRQLVLGTSVSAAELRYRSAVGASGIGNVSNKIRSGHFIYNGAGVEEVESILQKVGGYTAQSSGHLSGHTLPGSASGAVAPPKEVTPDRVYFTCDKEPADLESQKVPKASSSNNLSYETTGSRDRSATVAASRHNSLRGAKNGRAKSDYAPVAGAHGILIPVNMEIESGSILLTPSVHEKIGLLQAKLLGTYSDSRHPFCRISMSEVANTQREAVCYQAQIPSGSFYETASKSLPAVAIKNSVQLKLNNGIDDSKNFKGPPIQQTRFTVPCRGPTDSMLACSHLLTAQYAPKGLVGAILLNPMNSALEIKQITCVCVKLKLEPIDRMGGALAPDAAGSMMDLCLNLVGELAQEVVTASAYLHHLFVSSDFAFCYAYILYGVSGYDFSNNATRGVRLAIQLHDKFCFEGGVEKCSIGVATGSAYCGVMGSHMRCMYQVIGGRLSIAVALMNDADGSIWVHSSSAEFLSSSEVTEAKAKIYGKLRGLEQITRSERRGPAAIAAGEFDSQVDIGGLVLTMLMPEPSNNLKSTYLTVVTTPPNGQSRVKRMLKYTIDESDIVDQSISLFRSCLKFRQKATGVSQVPPPTHGGIESSSSSDTLGVFRSVWDAFNATCDLLLTQLDQISVHPLLMNIQTAINGCDLTSLNILAANSPLITYMRLIHSPSPYQWIISGYRDVTLMQPGRLSFHIVHGVAECGISEVARFYLRQGRHRQFRCIYIQARVPDYYRNYGIIRRLFIALLGVEAVDGTELSDTGGGISLYGVVAATFPDADISIIKENTAMLQKALSSRMGPEVDGGSGGGGQPSGVENKYSNVNRGPTGTPSKKGWFGVNVSKPPEIITPPVQLAKESVPSANTGSYGGFGYIDRMQNANSVSHSEAFSMNSIQVIKNYDSLTVISKVLEYVLQARRSVIVVEDCHLIDELSWSVFFALMGTKCSLSVLLTFREGMHSIPVGLGSTSVNTSVVPEPKDGIAPISSTSKNIKCVHWPVTTSRLWAEYQFGVYTHSRSMILKLPPLSAAEVNMMLTAKLTSSNIFGTVEEESSSSAPAEKVGWSGSSSRVVNRFLGRDSSGGPTPRVVGSGPGSELAPSINSKQKVAQLAPEEIDDLCAMVQASTDGNRYWVAEFLQLIDEVGVVQFSQFATDFKHIVDINTLVVYRYRRLPFAAQRVLEIASTIGSEFSLDILIFVVMLTVPKIRYAATSLNQGSVSVPKGTKSTLSGGQGRPFSMNSFGSSNETPNIGSAMGSFAEAEAYVMQALDLLSSLRFVMLLGSDDAEGKEPAGVNSAEQDLNGEQNTGVDSLAADRGTDRPRAFYRFCNNSIWKAINGQVADTDATEYHKTIVQYFNRGTVLIEPMVRYASLTHHAGLIKGERATAFKHACKAAEIALDMAAVGKGYAFLMKAVGLFNSADEYYQIIGLIDREIDVVMQQRACLPQDQPSVHSVAGSQFYGMIFNSNGELEELVDQKTRLRCVHKVRKEAEKLFKNILQRQKESVNGDNVGKNDTGKPHDVSKPSLSNSGSNSNLETGKPNGQKRPVGMEGLCFVDSVHSLNQSSLASRSVVGADPVDCDSFGLRTEPLQTEKVAGVGCFGFI